jgi:hypothetical protein
MMLKESSNISGYSKNMSLLPQETKFRQKWYQKQMCSTPHI